MSLPDECKRYRIEDGKKFKLKDIDPGDTAGLDIDKEMAKTQLADDASRLAKLQQRLYAEHEWAVLMIFQGVDTAGKDGVIGHVMSSISPMGCTAHSFKTPSQTELEHDYMWRAHVALPRRGHIGIFNRSYYEEVLIVRVHPEMLAAQKIPPKLTKHDQIWKQRYRHMVEFEQYMLNNGILPIKFFLHLSKEEQHKRLLERAENPEKQWKLSMADIEERQYWDQYQDVYEEMIQHTATEDAPWHVVPADNKWFTRIVVGATIVDALEKLDPQLPRLDPASLADLEKAKQALLAED